MTTVGIIGCGVIGEVLRDWLAENNPEVRIVVCDPAKGMDDDLSLADVYFVQIHLPTADDGSQDLSRLERIITDLPDRPVFVRTTILPGSSERLSRSTGHRVYFMPEFLTERTGAADFVKQPMVFTGEVDLLSRIFKGKRFVRMSSFEAEIAKYAHNVFGALKITYFNAIHDYCLRVGADWANVRAGTLLSGYINEVHTSVPGPDGRFGYGGKCFPKDVAAFSRMVEGLPLGTLLGPIAALNAGFRSETPSSEDR